MAGPFPGTSGMKILIYILIVIAVLVVLGLGYLGYMYFASYARMRMAPREEMFLCDKHGPIRKKHIIRFQIAADEFIEYCPRCYHARMSAAEKMA